MSTVLIKANIPAALEVLYPYWRYGQTEPGVYPPWKGCRKRDDMIWAWVPHPDFRLGTCSKACHRVGKKYGAASYYRPPKRLSMRRDVAPVRMWTGRKYTWFWVIKNGDRNAVKP